MMWKKSAALLLCLLLMTTVLTPVFAAQEPSTLKIGYIDYKGFIEEENGTFSGYGVGYLKEIAKYTGWEYEYVHDSWNNCLEKLKNKEIDLLCTAQYTPERDVFFDYAKHPTGTEYGVIYVRQDNKDVYFNDFQALDGLRFGLQAGSYQNQELTTYAKSNGFTYTPKMYHSDKDAFAALQNNEVDAVMTGSLSLQQDVKIVGKFGATPFYFITSQGNTALKEKLDFALDCIQSADPYFETKLYQTYYGQGTVAEQPLFTREEAEYIQNAPVITIGNLPKRHPISNYDPKTGKLTGITEDTLNLISKKSGLRFDLKPIKDTQKPIDALKSKQFDLVAGILQSPSFLKDPSIVLSTPILKGNMVIVGRKGEPYDPDANLTVATNKSFQAMEVYIKENYPNYTITYRLDNQECMQAVMNREADIMLQNSYVMSYWMQSPRYESLQIIPTYSIEEYNCIAGRSDDNPMLISAINKTLDSLTTEQIDQFVIDHTIASPHELTLDEVIYKYRIPLLALTALTLLCIALCTYVILQRQHNVKLLQKKNGQLIDAINQTERATKAKSTFLARMSHEIRTPMNAIVGITSLASNHLDNPQRIKEDLNKIAFSSRILLNIINDVLDMSAIESEKLKISSNPFDFKQLLSSISTMYYPQCKQKDIDFNLILCDITEETLIGDQLRVNQILLNLLSNAVKFTPSGGSIKVSVTQLTIKDQQVFIQFSVSDTGCGMSDDLKERLFKPFEQEDSTTAQKHGGSGLGLSITKNLVEMMNGAIHVETELGKGTTFSVELPFGLCKREEEEISQDKLKSIRALVVDDDVDSCEYASVVLQRIGVEHDCANSGEQALQMLTKAEQQGKGYDICFLDWKMPKMDGIQITRKIRELFDPDTVIIIISAYDLSEVEDVAKEAGANMFVPKPLFQSTVFNVLMTLSGGKYTKLTADTDDYDFTGKTVLLAEDNALNMEIAVELLEMTGLHVLRAEDGEQALSLFLDSKPQEIDAILMDIQMPIMDGYQATRAIRASAHPNATTIPILAMTANAFTEDISQALAAGMNGHIAKPIDTELLYSALEKEFKR